MAQGQGAGEPTSAAARVAYYHALIASMILGRATCLECITMRACLDPATADEAVRTVARFLKVAVVPRSRCLNCDETRVTFSIDADSTTPANEA